MWNLWPNWKINVRLRKLKKVSMGIDSLLFAETTREVNCMNPENGEYGFYTRSTIFLS